MPRPNPIMFRFRHRRVRRRASCLAAALALLAFSFNSANATSLFWDANGNTAGTGGTGVWDINTSALWRNGSAIGALQTGHNGGGDEAVFQGTAGTVTLYKGTGGSPPNIMVNKMTFSIAGYTVRADPTGNGADVLQLTGSSPTIEADGNATIAVQIAGTAGLIKTGAGTLTLALTTNTTNTSLSNYTGATVIEAGAINVAALANGGTNSSIGAAAATASNLVFGGGTLQYTGSTATSTNRLFTIGDANGNSATLDASGSVAAGTMSFTGAGSIAFGNTNAHTLNLTGTNTGANTLASVIGDNTGATSLNKSGAGTWVLGGANTYSGDTTIAAGILRLGAANRIPDGSGKGNVSVTGTLDLNTFSETINGLSGAGTVDTVAGGTPIFTVGNNNATSSFSGVIKNTAGTLALTKTGSGTLTLSGTTANTYSGLTTVSAGELDLGKTANVNAIGSGGVTISAGTVKYTGTSTDEIANTAAVTVSGGTLDIVGNSDTVGVVTLTSGNINGTTGTLTGSSYGVQTGSISAKLGGTGVSLTKSTAGTVILTGANSYTGGTNINAGTLALNSNNVLPDTGTVVLGGGKLQLNGVQEGYNRNSRGRTAFFDVQFDNRSRKHRPHPLPR